MASLNWARIRLRGPLPQENVLSRTVASRPLPVGISRGSGASVLQPKRTVLDPSSGSWQKRLRPVLPKNGRLVTERKPRMLGGNANSNSYAPRTATSSMKIFTSISVPALTVRIAGLTRTTVLGCAWAPSVGMSGKRSAAVALMIATAVSESSHLT